MTLALQAFPYMDSQKIPIKTVVYWRDALPRPSGLFVRYGLS
jgi:hypothetical protein